MFICIYSSKVLGRSLEHEFREIIDSFWNKQASESIQASCNEIHCSETCIEKLPQLQAY